MSEPSIRADPIAVSCPDPVRSGDDVWNQHVQHGRDLVLDAQLALLQPRQKQPIGPADRGQRRNFRV